jgi:predicted transcriptional regulator
VDLPDKPTLTGDIPRKAQRIMQSTTKSGSTESKDKPSSEPLSDPEKTLLVYLVRNSWCTANTAFSACTMTESVGSKSLTALEKLRLVDKRCQGERFLWQASAKAKLIFAAPVSALASASVSDSSKRHEARNDGAASKSYVTADQRRAQRTRNRECVLKHIRLNEPQSAEQTANAVKLDKSVVNGVLYSLYNEEILDKSKDVPPLWFDLPLLNDEKI